MDSFINSDLNVGKKNTLSQLAVGAYCSAMLPMKPGHHTKTNSSISHSYLDFQ